MMTQQEVVQTLKQFNKLPERAYAALRENSSASDRATFDGYLQAVSDITGKTFRAYEFTIDEDDNLIFTETVGIDGFTVASYMSVWVYVGV